MSLSHNDQFAAVSFVMGAIMALTLVALFQGKFEGNVLYAAPYLIACVICAIANSLLPWDDGDKQ